MIPRGTFAKVSLTMIAAVLFAGGGCGGRAAKVDGGQDAGPTGDAPGAEARDGADERRGDTAGPDAPPAPTCVTRNDLPPVCGQALCGNGKRDTCVVTACSDGTISSPTEACDGADVSDATCAAAGYGSGAMRCSTLCTLDSSGCAACMPVDTTLLSCGPAPFDAPWANQFQLAATEVAVALAWTARPATNTATLSVARLSPTLQSLGTTKLEEAMAAPGTQVSFGSPSIAPLSGGWLVGALANETSVLVHAVDATGRDLGRVTLDTVRSDDLSPRFVQVLARPAGGALAVWGGNGALHAATIAADGRTVGTPVAVSLAGLDSVSPSNAVWMGNAAFIVYTATDQGTTERATVLVRFDVAGSATTARSVTLFNAALYPVALGADDDELLLAAPGRDPAAPPGQVDLPVLRRLDADGAATAPVVGTQLAPEVVLSAGDDALLLSSSSGHSLAIDRLARAGAMVTPRRELAKGPARIQIFGIAIAAARRGAETIVAWQESRAGVSAPVIGLARLAQ
jgi:hypothetical protein